MYLLLGVVTGNTPASTTGEDTVSVLDLISNQLCQEKADENPD